MISTDREESEHWVEGAHPLGPIGSPIPACADRLSTPGQKSGRSADRLLEGAASSRTTATKASPWPSSSCSWRSAADLRFGNEGRGRYAGERVASQPRYTV